MAGDARAMQGLQVPSYAGDRRQEIVFIGIDMDQVSTARGGGKVGERTRGKRGAERGSLPHSLLHSPSFDSPPCPTFSCASLPLSLPRCTSLAPSCALAVDERKSEREKEAGSVCVCATPKHSCTHSHLPPYLRLVFDESCGVFCVCAGSRLFLSLARARALSLSLSLSLTHSHSHSLALARSSCVCVSPCVAGCVRDAGGNREPDGRVLAE